MKNFLVFNPATGQIKYSVGDSDDFGDGRNDVIESDANPATHYIDLNTYLPVAMPPRPSPAHTFNYQTHEWEDIRPLQAIKDAQWEIVKAARFAAEYAGFEWDGSRFDSDAISQQRLSGAVMLAQMDSGFSINWTLENDTIRTLNQMEMISVGVALGIHVQTGFAKGQALRAQIDAATTQAEVEAVVW